MGLTHSLKNLVWWNNVDMDSFFPKSYDLTEMEELDDFTNEFRFIKVTKSFKTSSQVKMFLRLNA